MTTVQESKFAEVAAAVVEETAELEGAADVEGAEEAVEGEPAPAGTVVTGTGPLAGHALRYVASLVSPGAQVASILHSHPFVIV